MVSWFPDFFPDFWGSRDRFHPMADDRSEAIRRGKSEHHTAACRVKHAGGVRPSERRRKVSQKRHRRFFGNEVQVRLKRRGKSSPLAEQSARQEKPHAVQDKTEGGPPVRQGPESFRG